MKANGQIQYTDDHGCSRHSDLFGDPKDPEYRAMLHEALDEFLDNLYCQDRLKVNPNDPNGCPYLWDGAHFVVMKY